MKRLFLTSVAASFIAIAVTSCGGGDKQKDAGNTPAEPSTQSDTKTATDASKKGMTVAEATDFLNASEANSGKEVTVSAFCWGSNERMDGKVQLNLGDKKLEGMEAASFSCMFPKEQTDAIKAIGKNTTVTVTGKISTGAGGTELNDCKILQ